MVGGLHELNGKDILPGALGTLACLFIVRPVGGLQIVYVPNVYVPVPAVLKTLATQRGKS